MDSKGAPHYGFKRLSYQKPELRHINSEELSRLLEKHTAIDNNEAKRILEHVDGVRAKDMVLSWIRSLNLGEVKH